MRAHLRMKDEGRAKTAC